MNSVSKLLVFIVGVALLVIPSIFAVSVEQTVTVTVVPGEIYIFSPAQNTVYNSRMIPLNISFSDTAVFRIAKYSDNDDPFVTLCRDCSEYGRNNTKIKPFDEGFHRVTLVGIFEMGEVESFVEFFVDSRVPIIHKTLPREGFANGWFTIEFSEKNPQQIALMYGANGTEREVTVPLDTCEVGFFGRHVCSVFVDLSEFDGEEIMYVFSVTDIAENTVVSRERSLPVDFSKPRVHEFNFFMMGNKAHFFFNVSEEHFDEINFIDRSALFPRWKQLCWDLTSGTCTRTVGFFRGEHLLDFEIVDDAGNREIIEGVELIV